MVLYEITDHEFLRNSGWSLSYIESLHCTEDGCLDGVTHYLNDPAEGLPGFYCRHHTIILKLR